ncbi:MAG: zinc ABC transporter substrate-binding protein [Planctomycetota bacterium]|nr:zinc ABC transporter substrate-binding protein [Planctomycetota bacterium]
MTLITSILTVLCAVGAVKEPLEVVTTTEMVADITKHVAGEHANVQALMGEGVDPHLYKPTAADAKVILGADVIFYSGLMLEGRMADTFFKAARMGKVVYPVTELLDETYLLEPEEFEGHWDPHVWNDVAAWSKAVEAVAEAFCEQDPDNCEAYKANAKAYQKELAELNAYVQKVLSTIPKDKRVLVTAHDAFNYFGRAYDVEVLGVQGLSTESEAGIEDVNTLVDVLFDRNIDAVFIESSVSDRIIKALIEGAKAKGHTVRIGGTLFSDAMGASGTYEGTYIGMIDHNATIIAQSLGGSAPEKGLNGRLSFDHAGH